MHAEVIGHEMRETTGIDAAMFRLHKKYGLDYWQQWMCRYKRSAGEGFIDKLRQVKLAVLEHSVRRDLQYLKDEKTKGVGPDVGLESLLVKAQDLLAEIEARKAATR